MICPKCHAEYVAGAEECRDCLVPLVKVLPAEEAQLRSPRSALAGADRALAICAFVVGAVFLLSLLLYLAVKVGVTSPDVYSSPIVRLGFAALGYLLGPALAWTALTARRVAPSRAGRAVLGAAAVAGLVAAAFAILPRLAYLAFSAPTSAGWGYTFLSAGDYFAPLIAMALLAAGLLRTRLVPALLAWLLLVPLALWAASYMVQPVLRAVGGLDFVPLSYIIAIAAQAVFWIALGILCLPPRGVSVRQSRLSEAQLTRRSS